MEKQKIYKSSVVIIVIIVLPLVTFLIFKNRALPAVNDSRDVQQKIFRRDIVSRDITPEISKIKSFLDRAKLPEGTETITNIRKMVENALNAWTECQELVNSKKVNIQYKRDEICIASYEDAVNMIYFDFVIQSDKGKIRQCRKVVLPAEINSNVKRKRLYDLYFNDDFNIKTYKDNNGEVYFYPSGKVESLFYDTMDGKRHHVNWSKDGNIINQSSYDKSKRDPLILESEEKARKAVEGMQEKAEKIQKENAASLKNQGM